MRGDLEPGRDASTYPCLPPCHADGCIGLPSLFDPLIHSPQARNIEIRNLTRNSKHEIRNPKQTRNSKTAMVETGQGDRNPKRVAFSSLRTFEFVSDFVLRVSDLPDMVT